jgi:hypothetical protein
MGVTSSKPGRARLAAAGAAVLLAVLAGCGGKDAAAPETLPARTPSPAAALSTLVTAARAGDVARVRGLLTPSTPRAAAAELVEGLGSFPPQTKVVLAEQIDETWAVAALAGPRRAEGMQEYGTFAVALELVGGEWKAHLGSGTIDIRPLGPDPGLVVGRAPTQVAAEFSALVAINDAGLWLDGEALPAKIAGTPLKYTAFGSSPPLRRGYHTVVAFAESGGSATATAWAFRVR